MSSSPPPEAAKRPIGSDVGAAAAAIPDSQSSGATGNTSVDMAEWERRLVEGDLPEDFLQVTEPSAVSPPEGDKTANTDNHHPVPAASAAAAAATATAADPATGNLVDLSGDQEQKEEPKRPMTTEESDRALAIALQRQLDMEEAGEGGVGNATAMATTAISAVPENVMGRLTVTVAEAKLAKNYGMSRMDPYCRVRIGHTVYETPTCANGAREPKWNKTFNCFLLKGTKTIDIEVYDECTFTNDALVAHATLPLPEGVFKYLVVDEWWPLSGQEGHDKEGMLHMIMSLQPFRTGYPVYKTASQQQQQEQQQGEVEQTQVLPTEEQLEEISKMFPNLDKDVITSVFVEKKGNQDAAVNALLELGQM